MTLFEYLAIAFSLVLSSAAMRLVGGLPHAFDQSRRYWVHFSLLVLGLATVAIVFWVYWSYRDATRDLLGFLVALTHLGLVYFLATTIIPENPGSVVAWREYYYSIRSRYFSAAILFALTSAAMPSLLLACPLTTQLGWCTLACSWPASLAFQPRTTGSTVVWLLSRAS